MHYHESMKSIETSLSTIAPITRGFIDTIHEFPSIALLRVRSSYQHLGDGTRMRTSTFIIRGYVHAENSIEASEALCRTIESTLDSIRRQYASLHILQVSTDEGFMKPYGICDLLCEVKYYEC